MILTPHILSGAAVGAEVKNPYLAAGLAIILHFILDLFPHGDYLNKKSRLREFWKVAIDLAVGLGLVFWIIHSKNISDPSTIHNILIGIFFSLLPDGTTFLYIWMKMKFLRHVKDFHESLHLYKNDDPKRQFGLKNNLWDILVSLASIYILLLLK